MNRSFLSVLIFLIALWSFDTIGAETSGSLSGNQSTRPVSENFENDKKSLARIWVKVAYKILNEPEISNESLNRAMSALDIVEEFEIADSDELFLRARILELLHEKATEFSDLRRSDSFSVKSAIPLAYEYMSQSLDMRLQCYSPIVPFSEKARYWSSLALRLQKYREIIRRFQKWSAGNKLDKVLIYAVARAALYIGDYEYAVLLARRGETLAMGSKEIYSWNNRFESSDQAAFRALAIAAGDKNSISTAHAAIYQFGDDLEKALFPWLLSQKIIISNDKPSSRIGGKVYLNKNEIFLSLLSDEFLYLGNLLAGTTQSLKKLSMNHFQDIALMRRLHELQLINSPQIILQEMSPNTSISADVNYDGYAEEEINFSNGVPDYRLVDLDQDGIYEWKINYRSGKPYKVSVNGGEVEVFFEPENYPFILSMHIPDDAEQQEIEVSFRPGEFSWDSLKSDNFLILPNEPEWDQNELWNAVNTVKVRDENDGVYDEVLTYLNNGLPIQSIQKRFREGEQPMRLREVLFKEGIPFAARQAYSYTQRREPLWELYERYEKGKVVGLAWHPSMSGNPEYLRDWALEKYLDTRIWDLDSDGWIDFQYIVLDTNIDSSRNLILSEAKTSDFLPWQSEAWAPWE